jgi:hypothetical protein
MYTTKTTPAVAKLEEAIKDLEECGSEPAVMPTTTPAVAKLEEAIKDLEECGSELALPVRVTTALLNSTVYKEFVCRANDSFLNTVLKDHYQTLRTIALAEHGDVQRAMKEVFLAEGAFQKEKAAHYRTIHEQVSPVLESPQFDERVHGYQKRKNSEYVSLTKKAEILSEMMLRDSETFQEESFMEECTMEVHRNYREAIMFIRCTTPGDVMSAVKGLYGAIMSYFKECVEDSVADLTEHRVLLKEETPGTAEHKTYLDLIWFEEQNVLEYESIVCQMSDYVNFLYGSARTFPDGTKVLMPLRASVNGTPLPAADTGI